MVQAKTGLHEWWWLIVVRELVVESLGMQGRISPGAGLSRQARID